MYQNKMVNGPTTCVPNGAMIVSRESDNTFRGRRKWRSWTQNPEPTVVGTNSGASARRVRAEFWAAGAGCALGAFFAFVASVF